MDTAERKRRAARAKREKEFRARAEYRRQHPELWPIKRLELHEDTHEYTAPHATPGECVAMVWQLTKRCYAIMGKSIEPPYARKDMPIRISRGHAPRD